MSFFSNMSTILSAVFWLLAVLIALRILWWFYRVHMVKSYAAATRRHYEEFNQATQTSFASCDWQQEKDVPLEYFRSGVESLQALGLEPYVSYYSPGLRAAGYKHLEVSLLSPDRRVLGNIGYIVPPGSSTPSKVSGISFTTEFVDGSELKSCEERELATTSRPHGKKLHMYPPGTPLKEIYESHAGEVSQWESSELIVAPYPNPAEYLQKLHKEMQKIKMKRLSKEAS